MGDISNKAEEFTGRAKQAVGDLTGDDELHAEGAADQAGARVKQGVDTVAAKAHEVADDVKQAASETVEEAGQQLSDARDKAADTAHRLRLDDSRVVIAVLAGIAVVATLVIRRRRVTSSPTKHPVAKKVAAAGIARALTR